jgi:zinc protease
MNLETDCKLQAEDPEGQAAAMPAVGGFQSSIVNRQSSIPPIVNRQSSILVLALLAITLLLPLWSRARQYPPNVPPPKAAVLPGPALRTLPNGLQVVVIERHSLPLITLRLVVKAGAEADPPGLPGTAQFVVGLLDEGTTSKTALQIAEAIDQVGGTVQTGADWDESYVTLSVLTDHAEMAFDLMADMALRPAFAPAEVERGRKQLLSSLEIQHEDPSYLADAIFDHAVFAGTPYNHPADGTPESVARIGAEDLRRFHLRNYRPSNSILAVVGDISAAEAFTLAEKFFGLWREQGTSALASAPSIENSAPPPIPSRRIILIDKPDAVQTEIRVGNPGIRRDSPDYEALTMANDILGGPATNRLFHSLRSEHGLTYGASSDLVCRRTAGSWVAKTSTRTRETMKAIKLILDEMKRLRDHAPDEAELDTTRSYLTGHLALEFETSEGIATQVLELMVHNLPLEYWNRFPARIQDLSRQEVWERARQFLDSDDALIVLVGDAASFERELRKLGETRIIPLSSLDLGSRDLERPPARVSAHQPLARRMKGNPRLEGRELAAPF